MVSKILIIVLSFSTIFFAHTNKKKISMLPYPQHIKFNNGKFRITENFSIKYSLKSNRLKKAANGFLYTLSKRTGLFFTFPTSKHSEKADKSDLFVEVSRLGNVKLGEDESYAITITEDNIKVISDNDIGAVRAFSTLIQLIESDEEGYYFPAVEIHDAPRFPWRGLLIDVCRHFMPVNVIKRNLDGMAAAKMNVLHLHLSEDQGFRIECKTFPKLHELGSDGNYYTQEQIKDLINYASDRGIRIVPEFDIPGHATSWLVAYPELASAPGPYKVERKFGIMNPTFNPALEETYKFFDKFFAEMSELFPDEYIHIGGDENNGKQWDANTKIQKFMKANNIKDNHELQAYFNKRILKILTKYNKKMIGWDEILHENVPKNIVIQSWRGKEALVKAAKQGYRGILSNGYYIDLMQPTEYHYLNEPIAEDADLTKEEKERILGGEATMWSEWVTEENIDSRIWPRTAAIAERLWSPANIKNIESLFSRLDKFALFLEEFGLTHISYQPKMLRRLVNGYNIQSLKIFVDVVEPLQEYKRALDIRKYGKDYTQLTPYTRVIDASNVDSKTVRKFNKLVDTYINEQNTNALVEIKRYLNLWKKNQKDLDAVIQSSPVLFEIKPMADNLAELVSVSLEGLELGNEKSNNKLFLNKLEQIVEKSKVSYGQVELVIVGAIEKLFGISEKE